MTVALGLMAVPAPVDGDSIRRYETGTLPDGGLWTALRRLSDHNHTGGLNGAPISVSSIPDGSITVGKLDPSVLAPYALTDGSKPFTGQVAMNSDAIVRDHLYFGAKPAGVADATLQRTGAGALRVDSYLGLGVNPAAWHPDLRVAQAGALGVVGGVAGGASPNTSQLLANTYYDSAFTLRAVLNSQPGAFLDLGGGKLAFYNMPAVAAGAAQASVKRLEVAPAGTLTLTPDAGVAALATTGNMDLRCAAAGAWTMGEGAASKVSYFGNQFYPSTDNQMNLGAVNNRWAVIFGVAGTINTSSQEFKEGITPLDPAAAMDAVRATDPVTFTYKAPAAPPARQQAYRRPAAQRFDWRAERDRLVARPLEAGARKQAGFVAEQAHPLFLTGTGQTNAANTAGIYLGALRDLDARLQALEAN